MRGLIGMILVVVGTVCAVWCGFVGGAFTAVLLLGYIGTNGNEAGRELAFMATGTGVGVVTGVLIAKLGLWLNKRGRADA